MCVRERERGGGERREGEGKRERDAGFMYFKVK